MNTHIFASFGTLLPVKRDNQESADVFFPSRYFPLEMYVFNLKVFSFIPIWTLPFHSFIPFSTHLLVFLTPQEEDLFSEKENIKKHLCSHMSTLYSSLFCHNLEKCEVFSVSWWGACFVPFFWDGNGLQEHQERRHKLGMKEDATKV